MKWPKIWVWKLSSILKRTIKMKLMAMKIFIHKTLVTNDFQILDANYFYVPVVIINDKVESNKIHCKYTSNLWITKYLISYSKYYETDAWAHKNQFLSFIQMNNFHVTSATIIRLFVTFNCYVLYSCKQQIAFKAYRCSINSLQRCISTSLVFQIIFY